MHQDQQIKGFAKNLKLLLWKIMAEENFHYKSHKTKSKGKYCLKLHKNTDHIQHPIQKNNWKKISFTVMVCKT
jgi:hypothetical protein